MNVALPSWKTTTKKEKAIRGRGREEFKVECGPGRTEAVRGPSSAEQMLKDMLKDDHHAHRSAQLDGMEQQPPTFSPRQTQNRHTRKGWSKLEEENGGRWLVERCHPVLVSHHTSLSVRWEWKRPY